jgi:DNA-binding CsgD family transcriptional regulator
VTLVDRDRELAAFAVAVQDAVAGWGSVMVVEGPPGIGKTALLAEARSWAGRHGMRTLIAVGGELERDLPFSIARQLFERATAGSSSGVFSGAAALAEPVFTEPVPQNTEPATTAGVIHGLYWLCANLAETGPLLLTIDDAHWADDASLRFLSHLTRRVADLPVVVVLAHRPAPGDQVTRALTGLTPRTLRLQPITAAGIGTLVRRMLAPEADDEFCRACAAASGGNPFLLTEALASLRADNVRPVAAESPRVALLRPETISRAVLTRLARLGPEAVRLTRALAVLGPATPLPLVARLAGLDIDDAGDLVRALVAEAVLTPSAPVAFTHPLVRSAIHADCGGALLAVEHRRAARLLAEHGAPAERIAPHLLAVEPQADADVVEGLRAGAAAASARGAPDIAATYLSRAMAEPPAPGQRLAVLTELGSALGMANRPGEAADALLAALDLTTEAVLRADLALRLGAFMVQAGRTRQAASMFLTARRALGDDDSRLLRRPRAAVAIAGLVTRAPPPVWMELLDRALREVDESTDAARMLLAARAFGTAATGAPGAEETVRLAGLASAGRLPTQDRWLLVTIASAALSIGNAFAESLDLLDRGIDVARTVGDSIEFRFLSMLRSHTALQAGLLLDAEADARAALALHELDQTAEAPLAAGVLVDALVDRGALDEAQNVVALRGLDREPVTEDKRDDASLGILIDHFGLMAVGRLRSRQNRPHEALAILLRCGGALTAAGYVNPGFAHWRGEAAVAYHAIGHGDIACDLAAESLGLARAYGARREVGISLRVLGLVTAGERGLDLLAEAVATLAESGNTLEHAKALVDQGRALRRAGQRLAANQPLRQGLDLATRCGADGLADQARDELRTMGARPRRASLSGPGALTASELRVAKLAAAGKANRDIAQALFVSTRTVEVHLTSTYRKLGIESRTGLADALAGGTG